MTGGLCGHSSHAILQNIATLQDFDDRVLAATKLHEGLQLVQGERGFLEQIHSCIKKEMTQYDAKNHLEERCLASWR